MALWDRDLKGEQLSVAKETKYERICFEWRRRISFPCSLTRVRPLPAARRFRARAAWAAARGGALGWERRGTGRGGVQTWSLRGMQEPGFLRTRLGPRRANGCLGTGLWRVLRTEAARIPFASLRLPSSTAFWCLPGQTFRATG